MSRELERVRTAARRRREALERVEKRTQELRERVEQARAAKMPMHAIAEAVGISRTALYKLLAGGRERGGDPQATRSGPGRGA